MLRLEAVIDAIASLGTVDLFSTVLLQRGLPTELPPSAPIARSAISIYPGRKLGAWARARWLSGRWPMEVSQRYAPGLKADLQRFARGPYDFVWVSKAWTYALVGEPRLGPTVVDLDDLEDRKIWVRLNDPSFAKDYPPTLSGKAHEALARRQAALNAKRWAALQDKIASAVGAVVVCSDLDKSRMQGGDNVVIVPNGYQPPAKPVGRTEVSSPPTIVLQGVLTYPPNMDAAKWLSGEIAPVLRQAHPEAEVRLVGSPIPTLHDPPRVTVTGWVPDITTELARADIIAVPLRYGSGTRVKILEAFAHRIPVVSTTFGAEGLGVTDGEHLLLGDTPEKFADACSRLIEDTELRAQLADNAQRLLLERYTWAHAASVITGLAKKAGTDVLAGARSDRR